MNNKGFRQKFADFMQDRYGTDDLARALTLAVIVLLVVSLICMVAGLGLVSTVISLVALLLILWCFFRMCSKHIDAREKENARWQAFSKNWDSYAAFLKNWATYHKDYKVFRCPHCGEVLKVPKGKGKIRVTCPVCHTKFEKKS